MSFYASGQKRASVVRYESPSQAPAIEEIHDRGSYWPVNSRSGTDRHGFDDAKTIFEGFVNDADFTPPIGDDRRFVWDPWVKVPELRPWTSLSSSTSFPTRPAWMPSKVRQQGPQSLNGIRNRDTISKDNTVGDEARMDHLLATVGKKVTGIKHQEQHEATSPGDARKRFKLGSGSQSNGSLYLVSQRSKRLPRVLETSGGDSYIDLSDDEDDMLNNTSLLPVKQDRTGQRGYNDFIVPNMKVDTWINPSIIPYSTAHREDSVPRQFNGIEIRMKQRKDNKRGKGQKSKKGEIGY